MRNLVNSVNAAFPGALAVAMLAAPAAVAQERAPVLEFHGVAQSDLLQAFKIPNVDALYGDIGQLVGAGQSQGNGAGALFPIEFRFGLLDLNELEASFRLQDRTAEWAPNSIGRTRSALMDLGAFPGAPDYWALPVVADMASAATEQRAQPN